MELVIELLPKGTVATIERSKPGVAFNIPELLISGKVLSLDDLDEILVKFPMYPDYGPKEERKIWTTQSHLSNAALIKWTNQFGDFGFKIFQSCENSFKAN